MGYSRWNPSDWTAYSAKTSTTTADKIFTKRAMDDSLSPNGVTFRESRDSDVNPNSTAFIVGVDVTGSMGIIADYFVKTGLGVLFGEMLDRKPISDPHLMFMAIGDADYDRAPLQVSQFEADLTIASQLEKVYVEHGGGGNSIESYELPYYFAANHTSIDCWEKRQKKGYIFTIGDEECPQTIQKDHVKDVIGDTLQADIPFSEMLNVCERMYHCFHIMIAEGNHARRHPERVRNGWTSMMGQRAIWLENYQKLSETIISLVQLTEGETKDRVVSSWSGDTAMVISRALDGYNPLAVMDAGRGVVRF